MKYFEDRGWHVERVGPLKFGYDLRCTNELAKELHVEVKGTQSRGEEIVLTRNEVKHNQEQADCGADHALYVVSMIHVSPGADPTCSGGIDSCIRPWIINPKSLTATEYTYRVPQ